MRSRGRLSGTLPVRSAEAAEGSGASRARGPGLERPEAAAEAAGLSCTAVLSCAVRSLLSISSATGPAPPPPPWPLAAAERARAGRRVPVATCAAGHEEAAPHDQRRAVPGQEGGEGAHQRHVHVCQ